jgi:molecular chaperone GrpE (heat shock protein)
VLYELRKEKVDTALTNFTKHFGDIQKNIRKEIDRFVESFKKGLKESNKDSFISEAIKYQLASPEIRNNMNVEFKELNVELSKHNLQIIVPNENEQVDPRLHKVIDYVTGGQRGNISSVLKWGLVELDEKKSIKAVVYKADVNVYK